MDTAANQRQRTSLVIAGSVAVIVFLLYLRLEQRGVVNSAGGAAPFLTQSKAKQATAKSFSDCYNAGVIRDEGDLLVDDKALTWQDKKLDKESMVFVVGGDSGIIRHLMETYDCNVFVFEGHAAIFEAVHAEFKDHKKVRLFNYLLGPRDGSRTATAPGSATEETVTVKQIGPVIQSLGIRQVKLLHLECHGCEYDLLEHVLERSNRIQEIQVAFNVDNVEDTLARYCRIQEELSDEFRLYYRYPYVYESWRRKQ